MCIKPDYRVSREEGGGQQLLSVDCLFFLLGWLLVTLVTGSRNRSLILWLGCFLCICLTFYLSCNLMIVCLRKEPTTWLKSGLSLILGTGSMMEGVKKGKLTGSLRRMSGSFKRTSFKGSASGSQRVSLQLPRHHSHSWTPGGTLWPSCF